MVRPSFRGPFRPPGLDARRCAGGPRVPPASSSRRGWVGILISRAEPQNRGRPLAVVHQSVGGCAPDTEQRGSLDEVENRG